MLCFHVLQSFKLFYSFFSQSFNFTFFGLKHSDLYYFPSISFLLFFKGLTSPFLQFFFQFLWIWPWWWNPRNPFETYFHNPFSLLWPQIDNRMHGDAAIHSYCHTFILKLLCAPFVHRQESEWKTFSCSTSPFLRSVLAFLNQLR